MVSLSSLVTSIPTGSAKSKGVGQLASLNSSDYDFSTTRYPQSVGTDDAPHYMVFNINLPTNSQYINNAGGPVLNADSASQTNYNLKQGLGGNYQVSAGQVSTTQVATTALGSSALGLVSNGVEGAVSGAKNGAIVSVAAGTIDLKPKLARVKKAIAIYMPETIVHEYSHGWNAASLTETLGQFGTAAAIGGSLVNLGSSVYKAGKKAVDSFKIQNPGATDFSGFNNVLPATFNNAQGAETIGAVAEAVGAGKDFTALALKGQGAAINPLVEMCFTGTSNRQYQFVFDFQPRSASDTATIQDIIKTFRMYAAPEINTEANKKTPGSSGRYFIPPAQFDISFYFGNKENEKIAKISTCALTQVQVNYNASGQFTTFSDGQPVHIQVTLSFTEMDIITREMIDQLGY